VKKSLKNSDNLFYTEVLEHNSLRSSRSFGRRMKRFTIVFVFALMILQFNGLYSQTGQEKFTMKMSGITDTIYKFTFSWFSVNMVAHIGPEGILLVDTSLEETLDMVKTKLKEISNNNIKYIINTHYHGDHTGGNKLIGDNGLIIANKSIRANMLRNFIEESKDINSPDCQKMLPKICIEDQASINFNGEEIKIISFDNGHTQGDIVVYFTKSNIVCMGDLLFSDSFPFIHTEGGGNVSGYVEILKQTLEIFPGDVTLIAGHGDDYTMKDLKRYYDMVVETIDIVKTAKKQGKSLRKIIDDDILKDWESWSSKTSSYRNTEYWISTIYNSL